KDPILPGAPDRDKTTTALTILARLSDEAVTGGDADAFQTLCPIRAPQRKAGRAICAPQQHHTLTVSGLKTGRCSCADAATTRRWTSPKVSLRRSWDRFSGSATSVGSPGCQ